MGKTSQRFHFSQNQYVPNIIKKWIAGGEKLEKKNFSAIGKHLLDNQNCAANYREDCFIIVFRARNEFELHTLESIFILTLKPELCKQKKYL